MVNTTKMNKDNIHNEIHPFVDGDDGEKNKSYEDLEKEWNAKILEVIMTIKAQYPELSKYIEEMTVTIPDRKNPEVTLTNLKTYYKSLCAMLTKYKEDHQAP